MAGDQLTPPHSEPEPNDELMLLAPRQSRPLEPHGRRFRIAYAVLAVVLGAAVGGLIVLVGRGSSDSGVAWSPWEPDGSSLVKTRQIASVVGSQYRLPSGQQLVAVIPRVPPRSSPRRRRRRSATSRSPRAPRPRTSRCSTRRTASSTCLCGVGSRGGRCAIGEGKATTERARLLHRESLELALYTFKYVDGVDSVVTLQPPRAGADPTFATFFQKDDFKEELDHPLKQTLEGAGPFTTSRFPVAQQARVAQIVGPFVFRFSYQQAPDLSAVMVLQPLAA